MSLTPRTLICRSATWSPSRSIPRTTPAPNTLKVASAPVPVNGPPSSQVKAVSPGQRPVGVDGREVDGVDAQLVVADGLVRRAHRDLAVVVDEGVGARAAPVDVAARAADQGVAAVGALQLVAAAAAQQQVVAVVAVEPVLALGAHQGVVAARAR